jgi:hypothetical protein
MSVGGVSPSTTVAIDINDVVRNAVVTDIDTEHRRSVLKEVVVVLDFQLVHEVVAVEGILIRPRHGDPDRRRAGRLTLTSSTVPQRCTWAPGHVYARGGRHDIRHRPAKRRKKESERDSHQSESEHRSSIRVRVRFVDVPALPEPGAREDEGHPEEIDTD